MKRIHWGPLGPLTKGRLIAGALVITGSFIIAAFLLKSVSDGVNLSIIPSSPNDRFYVSKHDWGGMVILTDRKTGCEFLRSASGITPLQPLDKCAKSK